jgi:hypothetical protein
MSKRHRVKLHHVITVYNDMFDHMDGVMHAVARKTTQWKDDLFFAVKLSWQKLPKYHAKVNPTMRMLLISAHIFDSFRKLPSCRKREKGFDNNPEDEAFYTTQYHDAFLKYVANEYCAKQWRVPVNKLKCGLSSKRVPSATTSGSHQSCCDPYDLSSDELECFTYNNVVETTPGQCNCAARLWTAVRLYLNVLPDALKNLGQINPNLIDYHSNPMVTSGTFWIPDITDWWRQQEKTHS